MEWLFRRLGYPLESECLPGEAYTRRRPKTRGSTLPRYQLDETKALKPYVSPWLFHPELIGAYVTPHSCKAGLHREDGGGKACICHLVGQSVRITSIDCSPGRVTPTYITEDGSFIQEREFSSETRVDPNAPERRKEPKPWHR